jgi:ribosomal protein S18 acetylase RimI-like enzyme
MENISIRQFVNDDYDRAVTVWHQAGLAVRPGDDKPSIISTLERNPGLSLVACAGGEIVGTVIGTFDGRRGHLYHLGVLPAYRCHGIGRRLVAEVAERLAVLGCSRLNLSVRHDNVAAVKFYETLGFETTGLQMGKEI